MNTELENAWAAIDGQQIDGLHIEVVQYGNGRRAIRANHPIEGPDCTITVNLPEEALGDDEFFVPLKLNESRAYVLQGLRRWATPTGVTVGSGRVEEYAEKWALTIPDRPEHENDVSQKIDIAGDGFRPARH